MSRGHLTSRSPGSWTIVIDLGRDSVGKRRQRSEAVKGPKRLAEKRLAELLHQVNNGVPLDTGKETTGAFLQRWLRDQVAHTTRPKTIKFYESATRLHITPVIGSIPVRKLTSADIQKVVTGVLDRGLSSTSARRIYATLHRALEVGLKWGAVTRNVADAITPPKENTEEITPPDNVTVKALLKKGMETPYGAQYWLLAYSGMRRGEVGAVKRVDLDLDNATIRVSGAVGRENSMLTITPPKSLTSKRVIALDPDTVAVLRSHLSRQAEHQLATGPAYQDHGLLFASPTGSLIDPDHLTRTWRKVCKEVQADYRRKDLHAVVKYRLHDLRHAHITTLIEANIHVKVIQSRAGHASPAFTLARYGHIVPGMDATAAKAFAQAMSG